MIREIIPVFVQIFGRMPTHEDRMKIQAMVWLLSDCGIELGDYTFIQYSTGGVHSKELDHDIKALFENPSDVTNIDISYAGDGNSAFRNIKELIAVFGEDSLYEFMNIQYGRKYCVERVKLHHACDELLETSRRFAEKMRQKWGVCN